MFNADFDALTSQSAFGPSRLSGLKALSECNTNYIAAKPEYFFEALRASRSNLPGNISART